jgi:hypothetical protein
LRLRECVVEPVGEWQGRRQCHAGNSRALDRRRSIGRGRAKVGRRKLRFARLTARGNTDGGARPRPRLRFLPNATSWARACPRSGGPALGQRRMSESLSGRLLLPE